MGTTLEYGKSGLRIVSSNTSRPSPRLQSVYPIPPIPVAQATLLDVTLETVAETGRKGIRIVSRGTTLPGEASTVWTLLHACYQGTVPATLAWEEIPVTGSKLSMLLDLPLPSATHRFRLRSVLAGQTTLFPESTITTPADTTLGDLAALAAIAANAAADGKITDAEKVTLRRWLEDHRQRWISTYDAAVAAGMSTTSGLLATTYRDGVWRPAYEYFAKILYATTGSYDSYGSVGLGAARTGMATIYPTTEAYDAAVAAGDTLAIKGLAWGIMLNGLNNAPLGVRAAVAALPASASVAGLVKPGTGLTVAEDGTLHVTGSGEGGGAAWGGITGTLSAQTDLQNALNAKASLSGAAFTGAVSTASLFTAGPNGGSLGASRMGVDLGGGMNAVFRAIGGTNNPGLWLTVDEAANTATVKASGSTGAKLVLQSENGSGSNLTLSSALATFNCALAAGGRVVVSSTDLVSLQWQRTGVAAKQFAIASDNSGTYISNSTDGKILQFWNNAGGADFQGGAVSMGALTATSGSFGYLTSTIFAGAAIASPGASNLALAGQLGSPWAGKIYFGDGTGWKFAFSRRASGVDTDLATITDTGEVSIGALTVASGRYHNIGARKFAYGNGSTINGLFSGDTEFFINNQADTVRLFTLTNAGVAKYAADIYANTDQRVFRARNAGTEDLNTMIWPGAYRTSSPNANLPVGKAWGNVLSVWGGSDTIGQLYFDYASGGLFVRGGNPAEVGGSGSWSAWGEVYTSRNIDTSSAGLAAFSALMRAPLVVDYLSQRPTPGTSSTGLYPLGSYVFVRLEPANPYGSNPPVAGGLYKNVAGAWVLAGQDELVAFRITAASISAGAIGAQAVQTGLLTALLARGDRFGTTNFAADGYTVSNLPNGYNPANVTAGVLLRDDGNAKILCGPGGLQIERARLKEANLIYNRVTNGVFWNNATPWILSASGGASAAWVASSRDGLTGSINIYATKSVNGYSNAGISESVAVKQLVNIPEPLIGSPARLNLTYSGYEQPAGMSISGRACRLTIYTTRISDSSTRSMEVDSMSLVGTWVDRTGIDISAVLPSAGAYLIEVRFEFNATATNSTPDGAVLSYSCNLDTVEIVA